jgi:hypothetical protein
MMIGFGSSRFGTFTSVTRTCRRECISVRCTWASGTGISLLTVMSAMGSYAMV